MIPEIPDHKGLRDLQDWTGLMEPLDRKDQKVTKEIQVTLGHKDRRDPQVWMALMGPWGHRDLKEIQVTLDHKGRKD